MSERDGVWLDTDYETEGVRAMEMAVEQLRQVLDDPYRWKWTFIAVHNALQAFMVVAVSDSDLVGAMTDEYANHWREQYEKGQRPTLPEKLAPFLALFARAQHLQRYVDSQSHPDERHEVTPGCMSVRHAVDEILGCRLDPPDCLALGNQDHLAVQVECWCHVDRERVFLVGIVEPALHDVVPRLG